MNRVRGRARAIAGGFPDERPENRSQPVELFEMRCGERFEEFTASFGEDDVHHAAVCAVTAALDQAGGLGPVDEAHRAVVLEQQRVADVADRRAVGRRVASDREQQLVLGGGDTRGDRLLFAPRQETP